MRQFKNLCFFFVTGFLARWCILGFPGWQDFQQYWIASDALFHTSFVALMKEELWIPFTNISSTRLSYPEGLDYGHWPMTDWFHWTAMYILSWFSESPSFAYNFYYLVGAGLVTTTMTYCLLGLGVSLPLALATGVVYSNLPFALERLHHLYLAVYFQAPLTFYVLLKYKEALPRTKLILFGVLVGGAGIYYAFFSSVLICALWALLVLMSLIGKYKSSLRTTHLNFGLFMASQLGFLFCTILSSLVYTAKHGSSTGIERSPEESLIWGLDIENILLPPTSHWFPGYASVRPLFFSWETLNFKAPYEGFAEYLGLVALLGVILCTWKTLKWFKKPSEDSGPFPLLFLFSVICLGLALKYGLGYLFAVTVSPQIRSWNRASLFVATAGVMAFALWIQPYLHQKFSLKFQGLICLLFALVALAEQGTIWRPLTPDYAQTSSDQKFSAELKKAVGDGVILGLPFGVFPEWRGYSSVETYGNFRYLIYQKIRAVFPTVKGTPESIPKLRLFFGRFPDVASLKNYGITGLVIDKADFPDRGQDALSAYLKKESLTFLSPDGRFQFVSLH